MQTRRSLRSQILALVLVYLGCVTGVILVGGITINEQVERVVWRSLLNAEMSHFLERSNLDPDYRWTDTGGMRLYGPDDQPWPAALSQLPDGLHDDMRVDGKLSVVLVRQTPRGRLALLEELSEFNGLDNSISGAIVVGTVLILAAFGAMLAWALGRAIRPLNVMADDIGQLRPDHPGQRIDVATSAGHELHVIGEKFNEYLDRNEAFIERERNFINSASHELRTPVAVMIGASELALDAPDLPPSARLQMQRVLGTAQEMESLIEMLLMLAKDPARAGRMSDQIALDQLLPEIVASHRHLTRDKQLDIVVEPLPACEIVAPLSFVQAAVGNLLRNAIENSDSGTIRVSLAADSTVTITDPGHGMSPDQISELYARMAKGAQMNGDGIGLELIARLSEHLGWTLRFSPREPRGTIAQLRFRD